MSTSMQSETDFIIFNKFNLTDKIFYKNPEIVKINDLHNKEDDDFIYCPKG